MNAETMHEELGVRESAPEPTETATLTVLGPVGPPPLPYAVDPAAPSASADIEDNDWWATVAAIDAEAHEDHDYSYTPPHPLNPGKYRLAREGNGAPDHPLEVYFEITPTRAKADVDPATYWDYALAAITDPEHPGGAVSLGYNATRGVYEGTAVIPADVYFLDLALLPHDDTYLELLEAVTLRLIADPNEYSGEPGICYKIPTGGSEATVTIEDNDEAKIYALSYSGSANHVTTDPDYAAGTDFEDWPVSTLISADHWFDKEVGMDAEMPAGHPTRRYAEDRAFPVSYVRSVDPQPNNAVTINAEFLRRVEPGYRMYAQAHGPDGIELPWYEADNGDGISQVQLISTPLPQTVRHYEQFELTWEYSVTTDEEYHPGPWRAAGASENELYVTWAEPIVSPLLHSLLHIGTVPATGMSTEATVLDKVWEPFDGLGVFRRDGTQLVYYGPLIDLQDPDPPWWQFSTVGLLQHTAGRCGAWARLFVDVLGAQGISAHVKGIVPVPTGDELVDFTVKPSLPGQGNSSPPNRFINHALAVVDGIDRLYDPSYGEEFGTLVQWEDSCLLGITWYDGLNTFTVLNREGEPDMW